jgi:hypothetical protein
MTISGRSEFKANNNPPPGLYNLDSAEKLTKSKSRSALIRDEVLPYRRP